MEGIEREGKFDVALVFDEDEDGKEKLLGIFTDADYIRVSYDRDLSGMHLLCAFEFNCFSLEL